MKLDKQTKYIIENNNNNNGYELENGISIITNFTEENEIRQELNLDIFRNNISGDIFVSLTFSKITKENNITYNETICQKLFSIYDYSLAEKMFNELILLDIEEIIFILKNK